MSTRSAIFIEVDRDSDSKVMHRNGDGKLTITPDMNLVPEISSLQEGTEFNDVIIDDGTEYLAIYCQHDGDLTGDTLEESFPNYDQLLTLAALGNCSEITDDHIDTYAYSGDKPESYERNKPKQLKESDILEQVFRKWFAEYAYIYKDGKLGKFFVDFESESLIRM